MTDSVASEAMASRARAYAEEHFTITAIGDRFEKLMTGGLPLTKP